MLMYRLTYIMKIVYLIIMFMYRSICTMEDCTSNYYVYVQVNIYYEYCISNHYVYVQVNIYYEDCTSNYYVYVQANIYYGRLYF